MIAEEIGLYPRELHDHGLDVITFDMPSPFPPGTLLSRAGFVVAKAAALQAGCFEVLLFNPSGTLTGASESTAFVVCNGELKASSGELGESDLVTRSLVLDLAAGNGTPKPARASTWSRTCRAPRL